MLLIVRQIDRTLRDADLLNRGRCQDTAAIFRPKGLPIKDHQMRESELDLGHPKVYLLPHKWIALKVEFSEGSVCCELT